MKKVIFFLSFVISLALADNVNAQKDNTDSFDNEIFVVVEQSAQFPGGLDAMSDFIQKNLKYPKKAKKHGTQGMVFVSFVIEKDERLSNIKVVRDIGDGCGKAAVKMVKKMPKWEPAKQRGKAVRQQFNLPLNFQL